MIRQHWPTTHPAQLYRPGHHGNTFNTNTPPGKKDTPINNQTSNNTKQPRHLDRIDTSLAKAAAAGIDISKTNLPAGIAIHPDLMYSFIFNSDTNTWSIGGKNVSYLTPFNVGAAIPDSQPPLTFFSLTQDNWVPHVSLPTKAAHDDVIIFSSSASKSVTITSKDLNPVTPQVVGKNEKLVFRYSAPERRWKAEHVENKTKQPVPPQKDVVQPPFIPDRKDVQRIAPNGPKTVVALTDTNTPAHLQLPKHANNRDRITVTSSARTPVSIDADNINNPGAMKLAAGETYDFMYFDKTKKWEILSAPHTYHSAARLNNGNVPDLTTPKTFIDINSKDWQSTINLPSGAKNGSRIIIQSKSELAGTINYGTAKETLKPGETISFKVNEQGQWARETVTIDLLLLYSDKARKRLGGEGMHTRLTEGLKLTNEALENSGANFRFRSTAMKEIPAKSHWQYLKDPINDLRSDQTVKSMRDNLKADGIYYEGTEIGGGLGHVGPINDFTLSVGSINAPTTVMRHELGHNMGVQHGGESRSYNQGYSKFRTVMGGNDIPFYSTPHRYTRDGQPLGIDNEIDAVRTMNQLSARVAGLR